MTTMERGTMRVCHECMLMLRQPKRPTPWRYASTPIRQWAGRSFVTAGPPFNSQRGIRQRNVRPSPKQHIISTSRRYSSHSSKEIIALHHRILELSSSALKPEDHQLPSEQLLLYVLEQLDALAKALSDDRSVAKAKQARAEKDTTATSALLGSVNARQTPTADLNKASLLDLISEKAEEILRHPHIFITPAILKAYVDLQSLLHHPSSFPSIFDLYASRPAPKLSSKGQVEYTPLAPTAITSAIDSKTANVALTSAIHAHNLPLAIDIINLTFCTPAFKRNKLIRQALLPFSGLLVAPAAAYALSQQFAHFQTTMDPSYATGVAFAGIMTYIFTISGLGYVVITTANDQMERVTWAKGVPLWERWVREEERRALDLVAMKWGFQDSWKRGEEEGAEWLGLKEFVGQRGMELDRVELMEGME